MITKRGMWIDIGVALLAVSTFHVLRLAGLPELSLPIAVVAAIWGGKYSATTCRSDTPSKIDV